MEQAARHILPGEICVVIGAGGLGHIGIQCLKAMCATDVVVVDKSDASPELARKMGRDTRPRPRRTHRHGMEVRLRIEPPLAQLAALRARPDEIARMREHLARINQTADADARELWDGALHRQIASSARNRLFLNLFDVVNRIRQDDSWRSVRERARTLANSRETTRGQHETIIDAIKARDPARAGEATREHLLLIQEIRIRQTSLEPPLEGGAAARAAPVDRPASRTEPA